MKKRKSKIKMNYFGSLLKKASFGFLALLLILSQSQVLSAFEAHVINVTATIRNDIPSADPPTGEFCAYDTTTVTLSVTLPSAYIWYTMNGSDPVCDGNGQKYTGPITLPIGITTIKARSCHDSKQSAIVSWTYDVAYKYCACNPELELVGNGGFETPVVTNSAKWDIFPSGTTGLNWIVKWRGDIPTEWGGYPRPDPALQELHRGVLGPAYAGDQYAELDTDWYGPGHPQNNEPASVKIYQDITTIPGENYNLKFAFSPRPNTSASENKLEVKWNGGTVVTLGPVAGGGSNNWTVYNYTLTASSNTTRLEFTDLGTANSVGTFLDGVSVKCEPCSPSDEHLTINEVYYDVRCHGSEGWNEWVEIYNPTETAIDISGWVIRDNNSSDVIPSSPPIPPDGFAVITPMANTWGYWPSIPAGAIKIVLGSKIGDGLNNDGDRVILKDVSGAEVDAVSYGTDTYAFSPSVPDVAEGHSIARNPKGYDTNKASDWVDLSWPNPGTNPHGDDDETIITGEEIGCAAGQEYIPEDRDTSEDPEEETEGAFIMGQSVDGDIPGEENSEEQTEEESSSEDETITEGSGEEDSTEETSEEETASDDEDDETANNEETESEANSEEENTEEGSGEESSEETETGSDESEAEPAALPDNEQSGGESAGDNGNDSDDAGGSEGDTSGGQTEGSESSSGSDESTSQGSGDESTVE